MVTIDQQIEFYQRELTALELSVKEDFFSTATSLKNKGKLFRGLYTGFDSKRGNIFVDFKLSNEEKVPRLDSEYLCFVVNNKFIKESSWGNRSYFDFLSELGEHDLSEVKLLNFTESRSKVPDRITGIFSESGQDFLMSLQPNTILLIGPKEPPYQYLKNLLKLTNEVKESQSRKLYCKILQYGFGLNQNRNPKIISDNSFQHLDIIKLFEKENIVSIQGPPGTGKTHLVAQVISELLVREFSVLLSALTNKASLEVCSKSVLHPYLSTGRIHKTNLKANELAKYPKLQHVSEISPISGNLILSTYYTFSNAWEKYDSPVFDFVIVEEASQAFLTTLAGAIKLGKKVLVVGDAYQIVPIVNQRRPQRIAKNISTLINGLESFTHIEEFPFLRKVVSYRLNDRSVSYTNFFYEGTLQSNTKNNADNSRRKLGKFEKYIHPEGGPTLIKMNFPFSKQPEEVLNFLIDSLKQIDTNEFEVAILTAFVDTAKFLQSWLFSVMSGKKILIETVDRVQGLDVDICFYVIPDNSLDYSLNRNRFNVATSRAKLLTIVIGPLDLARSLSGSPDSLKYLQKLEAEFSFTL